MPWQRQRKPLAGKISCESGKWISENVTKPVEMEVLSSVAPNCFKAKGTQWYNSVLRTRGMIVKLPCKTWGNEDFWAPELQMAWERQMKPLVVSLFGAYLSATKPTSSSTSWSPPQNQIGCAGETCAPGMLLRWFRGKDPKRSQTHYDPHCSCVHFAPLTNRSFPWGNQFFWTSETELRNPYGDQAQARLRQRGDSFISPPPRTVL